MPTGLLIGNVFTAGAGGLRLAYSAFKRDRVALRAVRFTKMRAALKNNIDYPKYATIETFLNIAGIQLPVLFIVFYTAETAGYLFLAMQVMFAPMKLVGGSLAQVFASRGPTNAANGTLRAFTLEVMLNSAKTFALPRFVCGDRVLCVGGGRLWGSVGRCGVDRNLDVAVGLYAICGLARVICRLPCGLAKTSVDGAFVHPFCCGSSLSPTRSVFCPKTRFLSFFASANFVVYSIMATLFVAAANSLPKVTS